MLGLSGLQVRSFYVVTAKELPWWYNRASYDMQEEECLSICICVVLKGIRFGQEGFDQRWDLDQTRTNLVYWFSLSATLPLRMMSGRFLSLYHRFGTWRWWTESLCRWLGVHASLSYSCFGRPNIDT